MLYDSNPAALWLQQTFKKCNHPHSHLHAVPVCDARDVLLYDGPRVQLAGGVMRSGANDLHATLVRPARMNTHFEYLCASTHLYRCTLQGKARRGPRLKCVQPLAAAAPAAVCLPWHQCKHSCRNHLAAAPPLHEHLLPPRLHLPWHWQQLLLYTSSSGIAGCCPPGRTCGMAWLPRMLAGRSGGC